MCHLLFVLGSPPPPPPRCSTHSVINSLYSASPLYRRFCAADRHCTHLLSLSTTPTLSSSMKQRAIPYIDGRRQSSVPRLPVIQRLIQIFFCLRWLVWGWWVIDNRRSRPNLIIVDPTCTTATGPVFFPFGLTAVSVHTSSPPPAPTHNELLIMWNRSGCKASALGGPCQHQSTRIPIPPPTAVKLDVWRAIGGGGGGLSYSACPIFFFLNGFSTTRDLRLIRLARSKCGTTNGVNP